MWHRTAPMGAVGWDSGVSPSGAQLLPDVSPTAVCCCTQGRVPSVPGLVLPTGDEHRSCTRVLWEPRRHSACLRQLPVAGRGSSCVHRTLVWALNPGMCEAQSGLLPLEEAVSLDWVGAGGPLGPAALGSCHLLASPHHPPSSTFKHPS